MKIGLISDVHSNLVALDRVMEKLNACDEIYCAGDVVGYYPFPNEVVEVFIEEGIKSVVGNHDKAVVESDFSGMNPVARISGEFTRKVMERKNLEWLANLPISIETENLSIYHGMPSDGESAYSVYIFPGDPLIEIFLENSDRNIVVGHTHIQFVEEHHGKLFINPGSIGQPRDGDPRAAYAIFDTETGKVRFGRVEYNIEEVCEAVSKAGLPDVLCRRLFEGY